MRQGLLLFCVILFQQVNLGAQTLHFIRYDVKDGLNQNTITSITQDGYGRIWIGTPQGISCFDGCRFRSFRVIPGEENSIRINNVTSLYAGKNGNLWIGGTLLQQYHHASELFFSFYGEKSFFLIQKIVEDQRGNLWLARSRQGLALFRPDSQKIERAAGDTACEDITDIFIDSSLCLWKISNKQTLWVASLKDFYTTHTLQYRLVYRSPSSSFKLLKVTESSSRYWLATSDGLFLIKSPAGPVVPATDYDSHLACLMKREISGMIGREDGRLSLFTRDNAIYFLSFSAGSVLLNEIRPAGNELQNKNITALFLDQFEVLWIGTDNGLYKANLHEKPFSVLEGASLFPHAYIYCIMEDLSGNLYFSSKEAGITFIDASRRKVIQLQYDEIKRPRFMINNRMLCMLQHDKDYILCGGNGLYRMNLIRQCFQYSFPVKDDSTSLPEWIVWSMCRGKKSGNIYIGTNNGLCILREEASGKQPSCLTSFPTRMPYSFIRLNKNTLGNQYPGPITWAVYEDHEGMVWIGTDYGLGKYDPHSHVIKKYLPDKDNPSTLSSYAITSIAEDSKNRVWIGTEGGGLNQYLREKDAFIHLHEKDGLASEVVWGILEDNEGYLWISTSRGLTRYHPDKKTFRNYYADDGLQSNEFTRGAYFKTPDGRMFFGGVNGVNEFFPDRIKDNPLPPKIFLSGIELFNEPVKPGEKINGDMVLRNATAETDTIILSHKNNILTLRFIAIHHAIPSKNRCAYLLEGFDKKWIITTSPEGMAHYTNLNPGTYRFRVKASNCDGNWSNEKNLILIIRPPFWQTWWFKILSFMLLLVILYAYFQYRLYTVRKKNIELERLVKERTAQIERQKEEIASQAASLRMANIELKERKEELEVAAEELRTQSEELSLSNHELLKLNATKDKLFSIIAHDLKNPFQAILGFSELLSNQLDTLDGEQIKQYLHAISQSSRSAYALLENLLEWARSQTNSIRFEPVEFEIKEITETSFQLLRLHAENKKISLISGIAMGTKAYADKNMITTVVRNLINNAIKFTGEGGRIVVSARSDGEWTIIQVEDNGIGMSPQTLEKLFSIDKTRSIPGTAGESGTGLGLIICKEFTEKNHGQITVQSEEGKGSCFSILLPASKDVFEQRKQISLAGPKNNLPVFEETTEAMWNKARTMEGEPFSVLVIDDNPEIRQAIAGIFPSGCTVYESSNGEEGVQKAFDELPSLIISDISMPGMDGFEVCRILKTDERTSHIPVMLLTAKTSDASKITGLSTGADDYVTKPFNPLLLLIRARNLIESRKKLREKFSKIILLKPSDIAINATDEQFLTRALKIIEENMSNPDFGVDQFVAAMGMGRTQLYKKIKMLTNQPINDFIRSIRLKRAAQLLLQKKKTIAEIAYETGFNYPEYFSKCFKKEFGVLPTEFTDGNGIAKE